MRTLQSELAVVVKQNNWSQKPKSVYESSWKSVCAHLCLVLHSVSGDNPAFTTPAGEFGRGPVAPTVTLFSFLKRKKKRSGINGSEKRPAKEDHLYAGRFSYRKSLVT